MDIETIYADKGINAILINDVAFDEEEKQNAYKQSADDDDASYSPPLPSYLSTDVLSKPPFDSFDELNEESNNLSFIVQHDMISPMNSNMDKADLLNIENESIFATEIKENDYDDEDEEATMILSDDLLNESDDEIYNDGNRMSAPSKNEYHVVSNSHTPNSYTPIPKDSLASLASTPQSNRTMMRKVTPIGGFEPPIVKMQKFRTLHEERRKVQDEEHGLSFNEQPGSLLSKPAQFGQFTVNLEDLDQKSSMDSDDSLVILQKEYQRELLLKDSFKNGLFDGNIDDFEDPHPKDKNLKATIDSQTKYIETSIKVKNDNKVLLLSNAYSETLSSANTMHIDKLDLDDSVIHSNINNVYSPSSELLPITPVPIETTNSLRPSIAKRLSRENSPNIQPINKYDQLFDVIGADILETNTKKNEDSGTPSTTKQIFKLIISDSVQKKNSIDLENAWHEATTIIKSPPMEPQPSEVQRNPPQLSQNDISLIKKSMNDGNKLKKGKKSKKRDKYFEFMKLPPIPGVITLKKIKCRNLVKGKMSVSETYYLRVYQGKCEDVETTRHSNKSQSKVSMISTDFNQALNEDQNKKGIEKVKQLKSQKRALPRSKTLTSLPS